MLHFVALLPVLWFSGCICGTKPPPGGSYQLVDDGSKEEALEHADQWKRYNKTRRWMEEVERTLSEVGVACTELDPVDTSPVGTGLRSSSSSAAITAATAGAGSSPDSPAVHTESTASAESELIDECPLGGLWLRTHMGSTKSSNLFTAQLLDDKDRRGRHVVVKQPEVETAVTRPVVFSGSSITAPPSITFSDVHFNYSTGEAKEVLNGLHMHVPSGAKQAVVGLSGSGKSSILMLLAGMYPPTRGVIRLNDTVDLAGIDGHDLRDNIISFVPQETALFDTSIRDNVWFPNQPPVGTELAAAEAALVDRARLSFVTDWSATVGERGQNLSGGERQRIAIARALSKPKPVLLLDEATSALDRESDAVILSHLSDLPSTILAVTHRMSAIEWSDRLTVVAGGRVVQEGSTVDLLKAPGPVLQRLLAQIDSSQH